MTGTDADHFYRPSVPPPPGERRISLIRTVLAYLVLAGLVSGSAWAALDFLRTVDRLQAKLLSAERYNSELLLRARTAESQLAVMLQTGDGGMLLANIDTRDMGPAQLRLVPMAGK